MAEIVRIDPSIGEFKYLIEERSITFVDERSPCTRTSAERRIINAGHPSRHPFQGGVAA